MARRKTPDGLYSLKEAAQVLGVSIPTLRKLRKEGKFKEKPFLNMVYLYASEVNSAAPRIEEAA